MFSKHVLLMGGCGLWLGGVFHTQVWQMMEEMECCSVCEKDVSIEQEKKHKGA